NIEYSIPTDKVMEDAKNVENDRYQFSEHLTEEAKHYLATRYGFKEYLPKPATATALPQAYLQVPSCGGETLGRKTDGKALYHSDGRRRRPGVGGRLEQPQYRGRQRPRGGQGRSGL